MALAIWYANVKTDEEKAAIDQSVKSFLLSDAGKRFKELLQMQIGSLDALELSPKTYDSPSWAYKQADFNGFRRAIGQVTKLFELTEGE